MTLRRQATICRLFFFLRLSKQNWLRRHTCKCKVKGNSDDVSSCPVYSKYLGSKWVLTAPDASLRMGCWNVSFSFLIALSPNYLGCWPYKKGDRAQLPKYILGTTEPQPKCNPVCIWEVRSTSQIDR